MFPVPLVVRVWPRGSSDYERIGPGLRENGVATLFGGPMALPRRCDDAGESCNAIGRESAHGRRMRPANAGAAGDQAPNSLVGNASVWNPDAATATAPVVPRSGRS